MLRHEDLETVRGIINAYKDGTLVVQRDTEKIAQAIAIVRANDNNRRLCSSVPSTEIEPGDAICFLYGKPDVNEPWRFGVVDKFNAGCWIIFTFNIRRRKTKKKDGGEKIVSEGPSFRQYDLVKMSRIRRVCRPAATEMDPPAAADLANFGQAVKDLVRKTFGGTYEIRDVGGEQR
jgi:hypothetical protein